ncbi:MAG: ABC transporter substrate-binding protein, partial [Rhizobiaceae bacterium]
MHKNSRMATLLFAIIVALYLNPGSTVVKAADEIVLGASLAKTGPYSTSARTSETAIDIAVEEINSSGGINGKKIKLVKFDTGGDPKQAQVAVKRFAV